MIVEYRRKDENISYLNEQSQFQANTTFGHSANFRLPYYAALRIRPSQFLHADSLLFTVGDQEFDSGDQIDPNQYLNPLLVCGYEYRFGVVAELAADTNDTTKDFIKYIPVSRSIIRECFYFVAQTLLCVYMLNIEHRIVFISIRKQLALPAVAILTTF